MSVADKQPSVALNVVVAKDAIIVDNKRILNLEHTTIRAIWSEDAYRIPQSERPGGGFDVPSLGVAFQDVVSQFDKIGALVKRLGRDDIGGFDGKILFQIDQDIPFTVVRDVMYNAGQAKFSNFKFVVIKTGEWIAKEGTKSFLLYFYLLIFLNFLRFLLLLDRLSAHLEREEM